MESTWHHAAVRSTRARLGDGHRAHVDADQLSITQALGNSWGFGSTRSSLRAVMQINTRVRARFYSPLARYRIAAGSLGSNVARNGRYVVWRCSVESFSIACDWMISRAARARAGSRRSSFA